MVPVLIVVVLRLSTLFDALPWFEWVWEPGGVCVGAWDCWDGRAELRRGREAMGDGGVWAESEERGCTFA